MKTKLLVFFILITSVSLGQTGGINAFPFLNLQFNARSAGLGGNFITVMDEDVNMGISNPSLLNSKMHNDISFGSALRAGGMNYGMLGYGRNLKKIESTLAGYIKYAAYGQFERRAINGVSEGTFSPFEMIAGAAIGKVLNPRISLGANLNFIYSQLETYNSFGASADFAASLRDEDKGYLITILAKNVGVQFDSYASEERAPLPIEVQMGVSYKLKHAPFRFSLLAHHLNKWDITYNDPSLQPTIDPLTNDTIPVERAGFFEKLGQHFSYQLEVLITKNIDFRVGFDYHKRKEFALEQRGGIAGLSFGIGLKFSKFRLDYGFTAYSVAGYNNILTFSTDLDKWKK